ncbi:ABC transporter permease [Nocardia sp. NEAU-G5]|uniref:ABC transporter permease n=1 Tax=Nocardia albiluteola TaxID=2842303 RepID=A0ABS6BFM2_9NOCA|nr:ABC transporter permease [Nocardia albiluteola]MBU3068053.1 ABC transporter permease [Nocardia albiluteola]
MSHPEVMQPQKRAVESEAGGLFTRIRSWEGIGLLGVLVLVFLVLSVTAPNFLSARNLLNILQQAAFFGIVAFAMTLVIVAGEIDISVGSLAALSSALLGVMVVNLGLPMWAACIVVLAAAAAIGAFAGWIRAVFGVPTFIATLALYLGLRGMAMLITNTFPIPVDSGKFFYWGSGKIAGVIPVPAIYLLIVFIVIAVIARKTVFGRSIYAVGGNAKSAELSGINVRTIRISVLAISALTAAVTGLLQSAQLSSGNGTIANGLEFDAIAAAIIGGASLSGGKGTIVGTLIGVLFIAVLMNGMVLLGVDPYAQQVVRGAVVLVAVLVNVWRSRRATTST